MKKLLSVIALLAASNANAALTAGDIAFTAFNADEDGFSLAAFADIAANTDIYFSDNEWQGSAFNTGESYSRWNTGGSVISAGSVVRFSNIDSSTSLAASTGTFSREVVASNTNWGLSSSNETVYAFLGTPAAPTTFLAAVANGSSGDLTGTGLAFGTTATRLTDSADFGEYTGTRTGESDFASYLPQVADSANWNIIVGGSQGGLVPDTTAFAITPAVTAVPEPQTYAMFLAGLGLLGFASRRRSK